MGLPCWGINKAQLSDLNSDNCYFFEDYDAIDINQSNIIRVLIADDHYIVWQGLVALLDRESDVKVVAQASNGQEAVTMFRQHQPDVTLMDLRLSVMEGVAAIAAICGEFLSARSVLLTTYEGDENISRGL
jgi:YesN/AraC family two-component response regulator